MDFIGQIFQPQVEEVTAHEASLRTALAGFPSEASGSVNSLLESSKLLLPFGRLSDIRWSRILPPSSPLSLEFRL
jgi:hypothetical protein